MTTIWTHDATTFGPAPQVQAARDPVRIEAERPEDRTARETLLDRAFGPARFGKTCERLRAGRLPASGLSLVARTDDFGLAVGQDWGSEAVGPIGTVRLWHVDAGDVPALMLGPLAVDARFRRFGVGARLMEAALEKAAALGHRAVILVGDAPYYARFGFERRLTLGLRLPGPVEASRFLGRELAPGALVQAAGPVKATGALDLSRRRPVRGTRLKTAA